MFWIVTIPNGDEKSAVSATVTVNGGVQCEAKRKTQ